MDALLLIVGLVVGVGVALALQRRAGQEREREQQLLRDELKAMSLDVLRQTGESLAERLEQSRRAEEERASGEMAKRTEEIKGMVGPVQEKLGRMESEIGRLERERRQAQGELGQMIRHLGDGAGRDELLDSGGAIGDVLGGAGCRTGGGAFGGSGE